MTAAEDVVTAVDKVVLTAEVGFEVVVDTGVVVVVAVVVAVDAPVLATEEVAEPEPVMAELVAVATELDCATLLGQAVYSAGPGMV